MLLTVYEKATVKKVTVKSGEKRCRIKVAKNIPRRNFGKGYLKILLEYGVMMLALGNVEENTQDNMEDDT